jgi:MFS transporter, MHS family, shikimate and dehydroshikimate transport protein
VRYTGASLGYQLASMIGGGLAPFIATALFASNNGAWWPVAVYMFVSSAITLTAVFLASETGKQQLDQT